MKRLEEYIREDHKFLVKSKAKKQQYVYFPKNKKELISVIEEKIKKEGNNCNLNDIDVSKITNLSGVFSSISIFGGSKRRGSFNGDISNWDVSNAEDMGHMFEKSQFNGDISKWDVSNVKDMSCMFADSKFNQDISEWDVSNVKDMFGMFAATKFNQDISKWNVDNEADMSCMFEDSPLENNPPKWYKK